MQKKNVILLVFSMLLFAKLSMAQNPNQTRENQTLWRISGNDLASPSYLLVTLHSQDKRAFGFSDSTIWAFDQCNAFAVHIDHDSFETAIFDQYFNDKGPNKTLTYILTEAQYRNVSKKLFERTGYTLDQTQISNPELLSYLLYDSPSGYGNNDYSIRPQEYFMRTAKAKNKKILSLESLQDLASMNLYTESEIIDILLIPPYYSSQEERRVDSIYSEYILQMYQKGDIDAIQQKIMMSKSNQHELSTHNRIIFNNLQHEIALQPVFIALDIPTAAGPNGVLNLLNAYGYNLEAITSTYTGVANNYEYRPDNIPWVPISSDRYGYEVAFPTKVKNRTLGTKMNDFYKVFDDGDNLIYYMLSTRQVTNKSATDEELLSEFIKNDYMLSKFKDNLNSKKISRSYNDKLINGIEIEVKDNQRTKRAARVQVFVRDKQYFYILLAESYKKSAVIGKSADRFFKSFVFKELPKIETAQEWKPIEVKDLSFSFASLGQPDTKEQLYEPTDSNGGKSITYSFFDHKDGSLYYLRCNNKGNNNLKDNYSIYEFENNLSYRKGLKIISKTDLNDSIFLGREYITDEGTTSGIIRLFYRGDRSYVMMIQHPKEGYDSVRIKHFINSFNFLPHQAAELSLYQSADKEYSLLLPQKLEQEKLKPSDNILAIDPKSGIRFEINKEKISTYKHYPSEDSMRKYVLERFVESEDSLFSCDTLSNYAPYDTYELALRRKIAFGMQRVRIIYIGNVIYTLSAFVAPTDLDYKLVDTVFNSFKFKNARPNPRPILPERDSIVATLFRELPLNLKEGGYYSDSNVKFSFIKFPFTASDFPSFSRAINALSEKDSLAAELFPIYFNAMPKDADINSLIPFLKQVYNGDFIEKKSIKLLILSLLSCYPNTETKACFKELILKNSTSPLSEFKLPTPYSFRSPLGLYEDLNIKEAKFLFPEILTLLNKDNMQPWMLSFFGNALDSAVISIEDLTIYMPDLERQFITQSEKFFNGNKKVDYGQQNNLSELLSILRYVQKPSSKILKRLKELLESKNENISSYFKFKLIETLLSYKQEPAQKLIKELCKENEINTYKIYCIYKDRGVERIFPKSCLKNQQEMAKEKLHLMSEDDEFIVGELVFVAKEKVELNGKTGFVYIFKMTNNWEVEADKIWYLAAVGFFSDEQDLVGNQEIYPVIEWSPLNTKKENIDSEKKGILEKFLARHKAKS